MKGLRDYQHAREQRPQGLFPQLRMADALARMEAAGLALERAAYAAALRLEGKEGDEREEALRRCSALLQSLEEPLTLSLPGEPEPDAALKRVLKGLERRRAKALASLRAAMPR